MHQHSLLEAASLSPRAIFPSAWTGHLPFAMWLIQNWKPQMFVELGTHAGTSYFGFCQAVKEARLSTRCYAVDTWEGDPHAGMYDNQIYEQVHAHNHEHYRAFSTLLRMRFDDALAYFPDSSIELLHIDGFHTYEAVKHDFETWLPKLSPNAIVLFHDTNVREREFGVWRFWEELKAQYQTAFEFFHAYGLGVIQLNKNNNSKFFELFQLQPQEREAFIQYFSSLGAFQQLKDEFNQQKLWSQQVLDERGGKLLLLEKSVVEQEAKLVEQEAKLVEQRRLVNQTLMGSKKNKLKRWLHSLLKERKRSSFLELQYFDALWYGRRALKKGVPLKLNGHYKKKGQAEKGLAPNSLFDKAWYLQRYPDVATSELEPFLHFAHYGAKEGRFPGPLMNPDAYLKRYPDVEAAGFEPFMHYIQYGHTEGRVIEGIRACLPGLPALAEEHTILSSQLTHKNTNVAVVLHLFYEDLSDEICRYLMNIPMDFTLFVTSPSKTTLQFFLKKLKRYPLRCVVRQALCPNKGRNFAPFLVEFRRELVNYDLFLHLHSKKSLRTGSDQSEWRTHLFKGLLANEAYVSFIINQLTAEESVGFVFPATLSQGDTWYHDWLGCRPKVKQFFKNINVSYTPDDASLLDFSVGGMFWARVDALLPLLDYPWQYSDFEEEPSHHDGTLAHLIERGLGIIVRSQGYRFIELDYDRGLYRDNWSEMHLSRYNDIEQHLMDMIDNADTVSFDFYDTLFSRQANSPEDIFYYIGYRLQYDGEPVCAASFYSYRKNAEAVARIKTNKADINLDDIYASFPEVCDWSGYLVTKAKALEFSIEKKTLRPRAGMFEVLKRAREKKKRILLISDSYMPLAFFKAVLAEHGILDYFNTLFVSSDCQMRKDNNAIWEYLKENQIKYGRLVHIGDNFESDVHLPCVMGIPAVAILSTSRLARLRGISGLGDLTKEKESWKSGLMLGPSLQKLGGPIFNAKRSFVHEINAPYDIGYLIIGPLLLGFITWLKAHAKAAGVKKLFFLSRDGYIFKAYYDRICSLLFEPGKQIESKYLLISRTAVLSALQAEQLDWDFILDAPCTDYRLSALIKSRINYHLPESFPDKDRLVSLPKDKKEIIRILLPLTSDLIKSAQVHRQHLLEYLAQEGFVPSLEVAVVDIGYSATIQTALQKILGMGLKGYYMWGTQKSKQVRSVHDGEAFFYYNDPMNEELPAPPSVISFLESIFTAPHSQVIQYDKKADSNQFEAIYKPDSPASNPSILCQINEGVFGHMLDIVKTYGECMLETNYLSDHCIMMLEQICKKSLHLSPEILSACLLEDDFCGNEPRGFSDRALSLAPV